MFIDNVELYTFSGSTPIGVVSTSGEAIMVEVGKLLSLWPMGGPLVAKHWWHLVATGCIRYLLCQTYITQMIVIIYCHINAGSI